MEKRHKGSKGSKPNSPRGKAFLNASKYCGSVLKNDFVVVVVVLSNFYQIFKESDYFENPVENGNFDDIS